MTATRLIARVLLATGVAMLPLHFAAAQGPWVKQPFSPYAASTNRYYRALALPGPTSVWGIHFEVGPHSYRTTRLIFSPDEGRSWQHRSSFFTNQTLERGEYGQKLLDACTTDGLHTWVLLYDFGLKAMQLWSTATGPDQLDPLPTMLPPTAKLVRFFTNEVGVLLAAPNESGATWPLYRTTDGGRTWTPLAASLPHLADDTNRNLENLCLLGNSLWIPTNKGQLLFTGDQGLTWQIVTLPITGLPLSVAFTNATNGLLLTEAEELLATTDGGKTWAAIMPTGSPRYGGMAAVPGADAYLSFGGKRSNYLGKDLGTAIRSNDLGSDLGTAISRDGGRNWQLLEGKLAGTAIAVSSPNRAWLATYYEAILYRAGSLVLGSTSAQPQTAALAYPNPSNGQLQLAPTAHPRHLTLTDALGRRQRELTLLAGATTLDLSDCRPGVYMLTSTEQGVTQTQRLVLTAP